MNFNTSFNSDYMLSITIHYMLNGEPGSVVGIANGYGLDGPGIKSRWG